MKEQKNPIQLTITEDDPDLVEDKVKDQGEEVLYVADSQREEIMKKLMEVKETLESLQINVMQEKGIEQQKDSV
jgi:hypothetical protein